VNIDLSKDELAFQEEVRQFFAEHYPEDIRRKRNEGVTLSRDDMIRWQKLLNDRGWFAVNWPVEYGGTGWTPVQKYIFANEMAAINAPPLVAFGVKMVAPIIYTYGSEDQKRRFLPDILASNVWWCQGYSEPGSGSDLASLKTRADRNGDHYIVNGTKTWTTLGQHADWIFCLVRTSSDVARRLFGEQTGLHAGVSRASERAESAASAGIVQTVVPGERYRFMNLAVAADQIKPEHEAALRQILTQYVLNDSSARIRFVGHASSPGASDYNLRLSRRRAAAFYALARQLGVSESQLIDADTPRGEGESHLNVTEQDRVIERALNRRVELFIE